MTALPAVLLACSALAGCSSSPEADVVEAGAVVPLHGYGDHTVPGDEVYASPDRIPLLSATFVATGSAMDVLDQELPGHPDGLRPPEGHELIVVELLQAEGEYEELIETVIQANVLVDGERLDLPVEAYPGSPVDDQTAMAARFAVAVPRGAAVHLQFTVAGRDVLWDLRANAVDPARTTVRTDCLPGAETIGAVPDELRSEGRGSGDNYGPPTADGTAAFTVELTLGAWAQAGERWLHKSAYLPGGGWAPDGSCWLLITDSPVRVEMLSWPAEIGTVRLKDSLGLTLADGQQIPVHAPEKVTYSLGNFELEREDVTVSAQIPADAHTATLTFTPSVTFVDHSVTTQPPPVTSVLTF